VALALRRVHLTLDFIAMLGERAKQLGVLQGTLFQALMKHHAQLKRAGGGGKGDGVDLASIRLMQRSRDGLRMPHAADDGVLGLSEEETARYAGSAAELRSLLRVKVEDDQDIVTAQRALAECGYFFLALKEAAAERSVSETELLRTCQSGKA